jgi:hypothetical protein
MRIDAADGLRPDAVRPSSAAGGSRCLRRQEARGHE